MPSDTACTGLSSTWSSRIIWSKINIPDQLLWDLMHTPTVVHNYRYVSSVWSGNGKFMPVPKHHSWIHMIGKLVKLCASWLTLAVSREISCFIILSILPTSLWKSMFSILGNLNVHYCNKLLLKHKERQLLIQSFHTYVSCKNF